MPRYAIKIVPHSWKDWMPLSFNKTTRDYSKDEPGMHILVYQQSVGIIGDATISDIFVSIEDWSKQKEQPLPPALCDADYLLPLDALYYRDKVIQPQAARDILSDSTSPASKGDVLSPPRFTTSSSATSSDRPDGAIMRKGFA